MKLKVIHLRKLANSWGLIWGNWFIWGFIWMNLNVLGQRRRGFAQIYNPSPGWHLAVPTREPAGKPSSTKDVFNCEGVLGLFLDYSFGKLCIYVYQVLQSDLVWTHKWPFQGLSDLHLGNQRVTLKKLVYYYMHIIYHIYIYILGSKKDWYFY